MNINVIYRNGDTGEVTDQFEIELKPSKGLNTDEVNQSVNDSGLFADLINGLIGFDEMKPENNGECYTEAYEAMSRVAWEKLGWFDVMVKIESITLGGETIVLDEDIADEFELQLVREEGYMYFYNL